MNFAEFVDLTRPIIGGNESTAIYAKTLLEAILTENGKSILDNYKSSTFKAYANGKTSIKRISKAMVQYIDPVEFSTFIFETEEAAQVALCDSFAEFLPNINIENVGDELASLLENIIRTAAKTHKKKPVSKINTSTSDIKIPDEQTSTETLYSPEDKMLLQEFTLDYDDIMFTMIGNNYGTSLVDMSLPNKVQVLYKTKWSTKATTFSDPFLKSYVFGLLGELNQLSNSLLLGSEDSLSIKSTRLKIRNLYVKLHPDSFAKTFPYDAVIDDWDDGEFY